MSLFRVYVDGALFYHPQMSKLAITDARIEADAENIDSMTLSAPFNHPYLSSIRPLSSTIVCKKGDAVVFEGRALDNGTDFYNTHREVKKLKQKEGDENERDPRGEESQLFRHFQRASKGPGAVAEGEGAAVPDTEPAG